MIVLGSAAFTMVAMLPSFAGQSNPTTIIPRIIVGIGFIGAGVIWKHHNEFSGITTAATIWASAAVGMLAGMGEFVLATAMAALVIIILFSKKYVGWLETEEEEYLRFQAKGMRTLGKTGRGENGEK